MNILLIVVTFSLIIIIHELGHFLLAKANRIGVVEFSLGMGPRILSYKGKETRYSLKLLPFGGSCMMLGEDDMGENADAENAFNSKKVSARISTILAGPIFNFILALILAVIVIGNVGIDKARIVKIKENSAFEYAGVKEGDIVTKINGSSIFVARELAFYFFTHPVDEKPIDLTVLRDGKKMDFHVIPKASVKYIMGCTFYDNSNEIGKITKGYPLDELGIKAGDKITKINGTEIPDGETLTTYLKENAFSGEEVEVEFTRKGDVIKKTITPRAYTNYNLGISYNMGRDKVSFGEVIKSSFLDVLYNIRTTVKSVGMLITGKVGMNELSGPVGVVDVMNDIYKENIEYGMSEVLLNFMNFAILISANLGVMNLLPIPALDGGRLVFLFLEALRGKPVDRKKEGIVHLVGFAALMVLMVYVLFNDVIKIFS